MMIRTLYVDDEPALLELTQLYLERLGDFNVETVDSAYKALELLKKNPYDAIVSDYEMPGMNGISFLKKVRISGGTIPFIIFTGKGREEVVIEALNAGVDFYLQKGGDVKAQFAELAYKVRQAVQHRAAERRIEDLERRETDTLNFLPDPTFAIDTSGHVIVWNRAMEELSGIPAVRMVGKGDYEYAIPFYGKRRPVLIDLVNEQTEKIEQCYTNIVRKENEIIAETNLPHPKGLTLTLMGKASPVYNRKGQVVGAIETLRDITELKHAEGQLKERERVTRAIFDSTLHLTGLVSPEGILLDANRTALDFIGMQKKDVINRPFWDTPWWVGDENRVRHLQEAIRDASEGKFVRYEVSFTGTSGCLVVTDFSLKPVLSPDGTIDMLIAEAHDITGLKQVQEAYRKSNEKLNLLTDVTRHDTLNQLLALSGFLDLTKEFVNAPQGERFIKRCEDSVRIIQEQISFTKDYQSVGVNNPKWQNVSEIISRVTKAFLSGNISINDSCENLEIYADPLIEKVFYNLIENAIRHGGCNLNRIDFSDRIGENGDLLLVYEDNGVGVALEDKPRIFERNFGKHTGFGLFLASEILSITGITITENGTPGKGARFGITVPLGKYRRSGKEASGIVTGVPGKS